MKDYSNSCVYKLYCKDTNITDEYVGSCKDIYTRIHNHKSITKNLNKPCPIHNFIRDNGGWNNWNYEILKVYKCDSKEELVIKEQEYIDLLKPTLNSRKAKGDKKKYNREWCKNHREYYNERSVEYKKRNRDKIKAYYSKKVVCDTCGLELTQGALTRHIKRKH